MCCFISILILHLIVISFVLCCLISLFLLPVFSLIEELLSEYWVGKITNSESFKIYVCVSVYSNKTTIHIRILFKQKSCIWVSQNLFNGKFLITLLFLPNKNVTLHFYDPEFLLSLNSFYLCFIQMWVYQIRDWFFFYSIRISLIGNSTDLWV